MNAHKEMSYHEALIHYQGGVRFSTTERGAFDLAWKHQAIEIERLQAEVEKFRSAHVALTKLKDAAEAEVAERDSLIEKLERTCNAHDIRNLENYQRIQEQDATIAELREALKTTEAFYSDAENHIAELKAKLSKSTRFINLAKLKFSSGNSVQVDQITIKRSEAEDILSDAREDLSDLSLSSEVEA